MPILQNSKKVQDDNINFQNTKYLQIRYRWLIQQEMKDKYLGMRISGYGDVETEVRNQSTKVARTVAYLNNIIWMNKHTEIDAKSRIYLQLWAIQSKPDPTRQKLKED